MPISKELFVSSQTSNNDGQIVSGSKVQIENDTNIYDVGECYEDTGNCKLYLNSKCVGVYNISVLKCI